MEKPKSIKRCPRCKSTNITLWTAGITGLYFCKDCRYTGSLIVEEDIEPEKKK
jgi:transposase-like protein